MKKQILVEIQDRSPKVIEEVIRLIGSIVGVRVLGRSNEKTQGSKVSSVQMRGIRQG